MRRADSYNEQARPRAANGCVACTMPERKRRHPSLAAPRELGSVRPRVLQCAATVYTIGVRLGLCRHGREGDDSREVLL